MKSTHKKLMINAKKAMAMVAKVVKRDGKDSFNAKIARMVVMYYLKRMQEEGINPNDIR